MSTDLNFMFSPSTQSNGFFTNSDTDSESGLLSNNNVTAESLLTMDNGGFEIFGGSLSGLNDSLFASASSTVSTGVIAYTSTETIGSVAYASAGSSSVETIGSVACTSVGSDSGACSCSSGGGGFSSFC